jgi:hypothetical protein
MLSYFTYIKANQASQSTTTSKTTSETAIFDATALVLGPANPQKIS